VDFNNAEAIFKKGVLKIKLPETEQQPAKEIEAKTV
jgi:HSP20 family molecular chaperone IbpA